MTTNSTQEWQELDTRLDVVDAERVRTRRITAGVVAASVAVAVALGWALTQGSTDRSQPPIATPSSSAPAVPYKSTLGLGTDGLAYPMMFDLPPWQHEAAPSGQGETPYSVGWLSGVCPPGTPVQNCTNQPATEGKRALVVLWPRTVPTARSTTGTPVPAYPDYVARLVALQSSGDATVAVVGTRTVGKLPATVLEIVPSRRLPGVLGCVPDQPSCFGLVGGETVRVAVIDNQTAPIVMYQSVDSRVAADGAAAQQFDSVLDTVHFYAIEGPS